MAQGLFSLLVPPAELGALRFSELLGGFLFVGSICNLTRLLAQRCLVLSLGALLDFGVRLGVFFGVAKRNIVAAFVLGRCI